MSNIEWIFTTIAIVIFVIGFLVSSFKIIPEYERGVVFRFGKLRGLHGSGLVFIFPGLDKLHRVDQRTVTLTIPPQEIITRDNVPARVNAVVLFNVTDPMSAVMNVENYAIATSQIAQTTLRSVLGRADLDTLLAHREDLNTDLREIIEVQTHPWGVDVSVVEIKDVEIPEAMQSSSELRQAADELSKSPASLQLRYLQTLLELGADQNSTVVFPLPMDVLAPLIRQGHGN